MKVRQTDSHEVLILEATPFAQGGEGSLYKVLQPIIYQDLVAKIYHPNKRTKQRQHKLRYLIKNPPIFEDKTQQQLISWPLALLEQGQSFVGFLMPRVEGELLEVLATPQLPKYLSGKWQRFKLGTKGALELRQKVCFNIAVALYHIHQTGHYVMVDLKPDNILIQPNGLISFVDMDSIEIAVGNQILFPAAMATPEFAPPEFHLLKRSAEALPISWDAFSMAVIFYKILLGIHPFAATAIGKYENATGLGEKLKHGLYVHNNKQQVHFARIPFLHQAFYKLPAVLQYLFNLCFVHGIFKPEGRPSAEDWCLVFGNEQTMNKELNAQLDEEDLDLYQPVLEEEDWLTQTFEDLFKKKIQKIIPNIINTIKKEEQQRLLSLRGLWKLMKEPFQAKKECSEGVQMLLIEAEIPSKWRPLLLQKIQVLFEVHELKAKLYAEQYAHYQQEIRRVQEEWQACQIAYFEHCHQLKKRYRKQCFKINQTKNEQPLWKAFVGKTVARKQAFLKQKYFPAQRQDLEETYGQKIKAIDSFYQPKWEDLEKAHYQKLDQIDRNKEGQKVLEKEKEELSFISARQLIIDGIQREKEVAKLEFTNQKKLLNFSIKNYIEQLEAIESNAANQLQVIEQSTTLRLMKLADEILLQKKKFNQTLLTLETSFRVTTKESIVLLKNAARNVDVTLVSD